MRGAPPPPEVSPLHPAWAPCGWVADDLPLAEALVAALRARAWAQVDALVGGEVRPGGRAFEHLRRYGAFGASEYIVSVRDAEDPDQEDGIWHDDGSRRLAVTWSLTLAPAGIEGGDLRVRRKESHADPSVLPTPPPGGMWVYATGAQGVEHKIERVRRGCRVVAAIWLT